jgi:GMP synthase (glutamine-hydrolysing)
MRAVCLQHVPFEGPGAFAAYLATHDVRLERWLVPTDGLPQDPGDLLLVMGGPMSVNDPDPWIDQETAFIRSAITAGKPVLGICLGSQLMAKALGAKIRPGRALEIGITAVRLTEEGQHDPVFSTFTEAFEVFEWHGEIFDLPPGSVALAGSEIAPFQAFRYGTRTYGLLFHLELEQAGIEALCRECRHDIVRAKTTAHLVTTEAIPHLHAQHHMAGRLLDHLLSANSHDAG